MVAALLVWRMSAIVCGGYWAHSAGEHACGKLGVEGQHVLHSEESIG